MLINSSSSTCASVAVTVEDFNTTGVVPLSNSSNIRLNSKSNSFDVVLSQLLEEHFLNFGDRDLNCLVQVPLLDIVERGQN
ncbi:hypothetical protein Tco_0506264 [Tanacetum coccineum]